MDVPHAPFPLNASGIQATLDAGEALAIEIWQDDDGSSAMFAFLAEKLDAGATVFELSSHPGVYPTQAMQGFVNFRAVEAQGGDFGELPVRLRLAGVVCGAPAKRSSARAGANDL